jgi:hypothetical protein
MSINIDARDVKLPEAKDVFASYRRKSSRGQG